MRAGSIRAGASVILGAMVSAALVLGCAGDEAPSTQAPSPEPSAPLPREWTCPADAPHVLVAQEPASHAPLAPVPGALAPVVTSMSPASGPLLAAIEIHGTNLRTGADGEYISFGAGEREVRIVPSSWSSDSLYFRAPLGAQGDVVVHTAGGEAKAGAFEPTFRSSAVYRLPPAVAYTSSPRLRVLGAFATATRAWALVERSDEASTARSPMTLVAFDGDMLSSVALEGLVHPTDFAKSLTAFLPRPDGVDLVYMPSVVARSSDPVPPSFRVSVRGERVLVDQGCAIGEDGLALERTASGELAMWTHLPRRAAARLVHDESTGVWRLDRETKSGIHGKGIAPGNGTVAFAWGDLDPNTRLLDTKTRIRAAVFDPVANDFRTTDLTPFRDDGAHARVFVTHSGITVGHCNHDSTGGLNDTSSYGSRCHVDVLGSSGEFRSAEAWPTDLREGYRFGALAGAITAMRTEGDRKFLVSPSEEPLVTVIDDDADVTFADGDLDGGAMLAVSRGELVVLRPR